MLISCKFLPPGELIAKPNPLAVLYLEHGSLLRAKRMSQFVREQELEDKTMPETWIEKARTEVQVGRHSPIFLVPFLFETVNHERLIFKVAIYHIRGDSNKLKEHRYETSNIDLSKHKFIGEQRFRVYDIIRNSSFETKVLENLNPKQRSMAEALKEKKTTITVRFDEIEQTTTVVSMTFSLRNYDNGKKNNKKTVTFMFFTLSRQRDMGEYVVVYTSEIVKYNYDTDRVNFQKMDVMLKDICRNEESTQMRLELWEYKVAKIDLHLASKTDKLEMERI